MDKQIVIKENGVMTKELCSVCGDTMKNSSPLGLFLDGTYSSVCRECAEEISPQIAKALHAFYEAENKI